MEPTISTITSELVARGIPRWDEPSNKLSPVTMPKTAWWIHEPEGEDRYSLHACHHGSDADWQLQVNFCPECGEVIDVQVVEDDCAEVIACLAFWPGLTSAINFALHSLYLWQMELERT
jgi:hypothetical protein